MFEVWTDHKTEHTLLITEDGVEILTARLPDSPGGKIPMPEGYAENGTKIENNAPA
jgi:methionyl aminopeptidase